MSPSNACKARSYLSTLTDVSTRSLSYLSGIHNYVGLLICIGIYGDVFTRFWVLTGVTEYSHCLDVTPCNPIEIHLLKNSYTVKVAVCSSETLESLF